MPVRLLALAVALLSAGAASAQEVRVRSGEHADFSRLVLYLPEPADIRTEPGEGAFEAAFDRDWGFDLGEVFRLIPRDRIAGATAPEPGHLRLDLACDCPVDVERLSDTIYKIDVSEPAEDTMQATVPPAIDETGSDPEPSAVPPLPAMMPEMPTALLPGGLRKPFEPPADEPTPRSDSVATPRARETLVGQVARAASQGLVEADITLPESPAEGAAHEEPSEPADEAIAEAEPAQQSAPPSDDQHVAVRTSIDRDMGLNAHTAIGEVTGGPCLDPSLFDVAAWLPESPGAGISAKRAGVIGEFDAADPEAVATLARAYIALSFGAEASAVLSGFGVEVPDADVLHAMADIVDGHGTDRPGRLRGQLDCPTSGALWAALALPQLPEGEIDASHVVMAFSALPVHLRRHLGPDLAERFLDRGDSDTAAALRNAIARAPDGDGAGAELLDVRLDLDAGRDAAADDRLAAIVERTEGRSAEAVTLLIERRLAAGERVDDALVASAASLARELKGTEAAARLTELEIAVRTARREIDLALDLLARASAAETVTQETAAALRGGAYSAAADSLDDARFLILAVGADEALGRTPEEMAARLVVGERLAALGLVDHARELHPGIAGTAASATAPAADQAPRPFFDLPAVATAEDAALQRAQGLIAHSAGLRDRLSQALGDAQDDER